MGLNTFTLNVSDADFELAKQDLTSIIICVLEADIVSIVVVAGSGKN